jgi:hypothetical protein
MNTVMLVSLVLCAAIAIWGVADPDSMTGAAQWLVNYSLTALDWYFLALCTAFLVIMGFMAFSKYGNIKLGADDDEPEFSTGSWVAMLFAAGMGSGLLFWGVAEPIYHFMTPPVGEGETAMAARNAMVITNLHWGLHAWSIYGCCALVIAYIDGFDAHPGRLQERVRKIDAEADRQHRRHPGRYRGYLRPRRLAGDGYADGALRYGRGIRHLAGCHHEHDHHRGDDGVFPAVGLYRRRQGDQDSQ